MQTTPLVLGIDLGTSGVRLALLNLQGQLIHSSSTSYPNGLEHPQDWPNCCKSLIRELPSSLRGALVAVAVDGTSGTIVPCDSKGAFLGKALPYFVSCPEQRIPLALLTPPHNQASSLSSSLARVLRLTDKYGHELLVRHQADWINGWLLEDWQWGEEGNNLRLGWDIKNQCWPKSFKDQPWRQSLPEIVSSGKILSRVSERQAASLNLPANVLVIAGTTDANAAVLTANPGPNDGVTILGSTIALKRFVVAPIEGTGITNHRINGRWLCGGASNAGGALLRKLFDDMEIKELSRQINPEFDSGLNLYPLPARGERFPIDDPNMEPILEPRPVSDALYLHGLLEGLARIEAKGWKRLEELGSEPPLQLISLGQGARNPQWRRLRERIMGIPVKSCTSPPAEGVARLALKAFLKAQKEKSKTDLH